MYIHVCTALNMYICTCMYEVLLADHERYLAVIVEQVDGSICVRVCKNVHAIRTLLLAVCVMYIHTLIR